MDVAVFAGWSFERSDRFLPVEPDRLPAQTLPSNHEFHTLSFLNATSINTWLYETFLLSCFLKFRLQDERFFHTCSRLWFFTKKRLTLHNLISMKILYFWPGNMNFFTKSRNLCPSEINGNRNILSILAKLWLNI